MYYFQTWHKVSRLRKIPVIGKYLYVFCQWLCGKVLKHEPSKTEWGYGGGEFADSWCRWCNKHIEIPKSVIMFSHKEALPLLKQVSGTVNIV